MAALTDARKLLTVFVFLGRESLGGLKNGDDDDEEKEEEEEEEAKPAAVAKAASFCPLRMFCCRQSSIM